MTWRCFFLDLKHFGDSTEGRTNYTNVLNSNSRWHSILLNFHSPKLGVLFLAKVCYNTHFMTIFSKHQHAAINAALSIVNVIMGSGIYSRHRLSSKIMSYSESILTELKWSISSTRIDFVICHAELWFLFGQSWSPYNSKIRDSLIVALRSF